MRRWAGTQKRTLGEWPSSRHACRASASQRRVDAKRGDRRGWCLTPLPNLTTLCCHLPRQTPSTEHQLLHHGSSPCEFFKLAVCSPPKYTSRVACRHVLHNTVRLISGPLMHLRRCLRSFLACQVTAEGPTARAPLESTPRNAYVEQRPPRGVACRTTSRHALPRRARSRLPCVE